MLKIIRNTQQHKSMPLKTTRNNKILTSPLLSVLSIRENACGQYAPCNQIHVHISLTTSAHYSNKRH